MLNLREIVNDYIERMENICESKITLCQKQLDYEMAEMRTFNRFRQDILQMDGAKIGNGIPENKFFVPEDWSDDRSDDGDEDMGLESQDPQT